MKSTLTRQIVLSALSLTLTACATPVASPLATAPVQVADTASAPAPAQPAPQEAVPAAPSVATTGEQASVHVTGVATFGADALSGYALKAYDAVSNAELSLTGTPTTGVKGTFDVTVAGVAAGRINSASTRGRLEGWTFCCVNHLCTSGCCQRRVSGPKTTPHRPRNSSTSF